MQNDQTPKPAAAESSTVCLDHSVMQGRLKDHVPPEAIHIVSYPDTRLKRVATPVAAVDDKVQAAALSMLQLHYATPNCAALAATQLSFQEPWLMTVIDYSPEQNQPLVLINPELSEFSGEQQEMEGCMSVFPNHIHEIVKRPQRLRVKALDFFGKPLDFYAEDFFAKCIHHEVEHLQGKIYLDRLSSIRRSRLVKQIKMVKKKQEQNLGK